MGYASSELARVNRDCLALVSEVRKECAPTGAVLLTAPLGPKLAGYHPDRDDTPETMTAYHSAQAEALADLELDLVSVAAMPGAVDAIGASTAVSRTGLPYTVGFIITADGTLLDGTSLADLIARLDDSLDPRPLFYVLGCTHPSVCATVLDRGGASLARVRGIKANGSSLAPAELLALDRPLADPPEAFADALLALGEPRGFRIYGGCCGTDTGHVESIARRIAALERQDSAV
jgi:homocysteine S-methyltransferase